MTLDLVAHPLYDKPAVRPCVYCSTFQGVVYRPSMTSYYYEGERNTDEDPNRSLELCWACWESYQEYWQERWDEYYSSVL